MVQRVMWRRPILHIGMGNDDSTSGCRCRWKRPPVHFIRVEKIETVFADWCVTGSNSPPVCLIGIMKHGMHRMRRQRFRRFSTGINVCTSGWSGPPACFVRIMKQGIGTTRRRRRFSRKQEQWHRRLVLWFMRILGRLVDRQLFDAGFGFTWCY